MGREIKFRGLTKSFKEEDYEYIGEWKYGFFHIDAKGVCFIIEDSKSGRVYPGSEVIPESVGQFIGLKDNNDVQVFTGDNIEIHWLMGESTVETISYDENYGYWKYGNNPICELFDPPVIFEVISNIHQNPELLKEINNNV